jgi:hypothetical protein
MTRPLTIVLSLLLLAAGVRADTLVDVRAAVSQLHATKAIHASIAIERSRKSEGRFANQQFSGGAVVDVVDDENGLHVAFSRALLDKAEREAREHEVDPRKPTPTRAAINDTQPTELADAVDFAAPFLNLLAIATRVSETRGTRDGKPVRAIVLKLTPKLPPEATSVWNVKFTEDRMTLWIGDDNLPVAAERSRKGTAGFLFIKGSMTDRQSWLFGHYGDRLVVLRSETSFVGAGFGQRGEGRDIATLTIR